MGDTVHLSGMCQYLILSYIDVFQETAQERGVWGCNNRDTRVMLLLAGKLLPAAVGG